MITFGDDVFLRSTGPYKDAGIREWDIITSGGVSVVVIHVTPTTITYSPSRIRYWVARVRGLALRIRGWWRTRNNQRRER